MPRDGTTHPSLEAEPDSMLLMLGDIYDKSVAAANALDGQNDSSLSQKAYDVVTCVEEQIIDTKAATFNGLLVKARTLNRIHEIAQDGLGDENIFHQAFHLLPLEVGLGSDQRLIGSMVRDLAAMAGAAP